MIWFKSIFENETAQYKTTSITAWLLHGYTYLFAEGTLELWPRDLSN